MPPRIVKTVPNLAVKEGSRVLVPCVAHGHPSPRYRWLLFILKFSYEFSSCFIGWNVFHSWCYHRDIKDQCRQISAEGIRFSAGSLLVMATKESSGIYKCTAANNMGQETTATKLTVYCKLKHYEFALAFSPNRLLCTLSLRGVSVVPRISELRGSWPRLKYKSSHIADLLVKYVILDFLKTISNLKKDIFLKGMLRFKGALWLCSPLYS